MAEARAVWRSRWYDRTGAALYDFAVERESLARVLGLLIFGTDARLLYRSMSVVAKMPDGAAILDAPCGGGLAFRALGRRQRVRYVAADLSRGMLRRARRVAERRGLDQIEFVEADIESLPFKDASFDLCLCFNSLHCFDRPEAALSEVARCLRPGGRLVGDSAIRGAGRRYDALIAVYRRAGVLGRVPDLAELRSWLDAAHLRDLRLQVSGSIAHFDARR
jgi:ubiquinone/menaquinone biosynthesis C-methylase UbiE